MIAAGQLRHVIGVEAGGGTLPEIVAGLMGQVGEMNLTTLGIGVGVLAFDPDQELIGLGAANIASGILSGYPVTGGFARSVVNFDAGAQTPAAGIFTAIGIALAAMFLTPLLQHLPQATLAATIIVAVLSLIDPGALRRVFDYSKSDFAAMAVTIFVTLGWGPRSGLSRGLCSR